MTRKLVLELPTGTGPVLNQVGADDEHQLQEQIKLQPELLPVDELGLTEAPLVVGRETSLPSGAIDLVLLDQAGELCLVEFKTGPQNSDFRACLAQLVDYGSDLWGMTVEDFEAKVAVRYFTGKHCPAGSPGHQHTSLADAIAAAWPNQTSSADAFDWRDRLAAQLTAGAFLYVVVAQRFHASVLGTIRYLNASMPRAQFHAVELVRFAADGYGAYETRHLLGPETTGGRDRAQALAGSAELLGLVEDDTYRGALETFIGGLEQIDGLNIFYGTTGISLRVTVPDHAPVSIGWFFPPGPPRWLGLTNLTLGYYTEQPSVSDAQRSVLDGYAATVAALPGAKPAKKPTFNASTFLPDVVKTQHPQMLAAVQDVAIALTSG
jgi:hypothetical protein